MYQPTYDPYGPQADHYTSTAPGMPYPAPPAPFEQYRSTEHTYPTFQDQYYSSSNSYDSQSYGSQPYVSQSSHYRANPNFPPSQSEQYPSPYPPLSHSSSNRYPPLAQTTPSLYPSVSSAPSEHYTPAETYAHPYSTQNVASSSNAYSLPGTSYGSTSPSYTPATENSWPSSYGSYPNSPPISAPLHGNSEFDIHVPNPYAKVPPASNLHVKPPYKDHDEHHEGLGRHAAPVLFESTKLERQDTGGHGPEQEKRKSNEMQELATHALQKRELKKDNIRFSVEEAQLIMKHLKETIKNLNLQLTNSRESTMKLLQEKDALKVSNELLRKESDDLRAQSSNKPPAFDHREAFAAVERAQKLNLKEQDKEELLGQTAKHTETVAVIEREWIQKLSLKEQEKQELLARAEENTEAIAQLEREWAERLSAKEQENTVLLARVAKLQSDSENGRAILLETNVAQEAELMKLREETAQLLDETTQLVDERDNAQAEIERLEGEKRELQDLLNQSKGSAADSMEHEKASALEQQNLSETVTDLEKELEGYRDLCEERRLRIEELESRDSPSVTSDLELERTLHKEAQDTIAELEAKLENALEELEDCKHACESLEQQLFESEKREMESNLRAAGEIRSAEEELDTLRSQLNSHLSAERENEKWALELESEKRKLEGKLAQLEGENRQLLESVSTLEKSLEGVTADRDKLQEELEWNREAFERETQEAEEADYSNRLRIEELEAQLSIITSAKSTLEARAAQLETQKNEVERILHATEDMFRAMKEESESSKVETENDLETDKALLEEKLADLQDEHLQMSERLSELEKRLNDVAMERDMQMKQVKVLEIEKSKLVGKLEARESLLIQNQEELAINEVDLKKAWGDLQDLELEMKKDKKEMDRLRVDIAKLTRVKQEAQERVRELEETRADLEAKAVAILRDRATALASASAVEADYKALEGRYTAMSLQYAEVQEERDVVLLANRNLRFK